MRLFSVLLFTLTLLTAKGQTYNFKTFGNEELLTEFFYAFDQDELGRLYAATSRGLLIYDGVDFELISTEDGLLHDFVSNVYIDSQNRIWLSYYQGGLACINGKTITNFGETYAVNSIGEDSDQVLNISTDEGIFTYQNNHISKIDGPENLTFMSIIPNGHTVVLTRENELYIQPKNEIFYPLVDQVSHITSSTMNNQLALIRNDSLLIYDLPATTSPKKLTGTALKAFDLDADQIASLFFSDSTLIISSYERGAVEINFGKDFFMYQSTQYTTSNGLSGNNIQCSFIDNERNIWFGTYGNGLNMLPKNKIVFVNNSENPAKNRINAISRYGRSVLFGTDAGITPIDTDLINDFTSLNQKHITALTYNNDTLWAGTANGLLYYYDGNTVSPFPTDLSPGFQINCIQRHENKLFLGTNNGLVVYNFHTSEIIHLTTNEGLAHNIIESITIDSQGRFWFVSPNSPVYFYKDGEWSYFRNIPGFESYNLTTVKEIDGTIYMGTQGDGVFRYSADRFEQFTVKDGLFSNYIYCIEQLANGSIICGHKNSVSVLPANTTRFWNIGNYNQLKYIVPRSSFIAEDNIVIGTSLGVVNLINLSLFSSVYEPKLAITQIAVNRKPVTVAETVELPYGDYLINVDFNAIYLSNPEAISYRYKLKGFDKDWTEDGFNHNKALYQSVSSGEYEFLVQLMVNDIPRGEPNVVRISINLPFWQTTFFYILLVFAFLLTFISVIYITNKRNAYIKQVLERKVERRTLMINRKNNEILQMNDHLKQLSDQYLDAKNIAELQTAEMKKSIAYALHIQKVTLRKKDYLSWIEEFSDFFLLFKPKDQVSGDFYWAHKEGKYTYIAVADCTGHGVPGAMISMLGVSILKEVIIQYKETDAILNHTRERIINELGQNTLQSRVSDGMDIALIRLDWETKMMQYSGAFNPAYIIRPQETNATLDQNLTLLKENDQVQLLSTEPNRQPIGHYFETSPFTKVDIQMHPQDQVYLLSDGYVDQFGGKRNKKFMRKRLYDLMLTIQHLPGEEQKDKLWHTLEEWMGDREQIDDISILGFKL